MPIPRGIPASAASSPSLKPMAWATTSTARLFSRSARRANVPKHSWSVFHPRASRAALYPERLRVAHFPHLNLVQTHVNPTRFQTQLMRWGSTLAAAAAVYQFATNLHTVPITGRTQVVVLSREDECEMGEETAKQIIALSRVIEDGPRHRMVVDVASRLISVAEHHFPRKYDWKVTLVDKPQSPNACCAPGGQIIVDSGLLDLIDFAIEKGICEDKHDALAVVLAHEIGHALARHTAETMSFLPLDILQALLGFQSPLIEYIYKYAMDLPFSRKQEMEADHIGIMLMSSACYDPREAPRLWRGFTAFYSEFCALSDLEIAFDLNSTHPSNHKREKRLDELVPEALELQRKSSWCFQLKERVQQLLQDREEDADEHHQATSALMRHLHRLFFPQEGEEKEGERAPQRRRATVGTIHEMENREVARILEQVSNTEPSAEASGQDA